MMDQDDFEELLKIQRLMASKLNQENKVDNKIKLLNLLRELTKNGKKEIQTERLLIAATEEGLTENEILRYLEELERDNMVQKPKVGYINTK